jgi:transposase
MKGKSTQMKVTRKAVEFKPDFFFNVCCDVHKDELYFFAKEPGTEYETRCQNRTASVTKTLKAFEEEAAKVGKTVVRIVCEPTGQYDRVLLRTAHRLGFATSYVNTESVCKYRLIETNDNGKTDTKDPCVINSLATQNKVIRCRQYNVDYLTLRKLGSLAEDEEVVMVRLRGDLHREIFDLFCDYDFKKDFLYTCSGKSLVDLYGCNPYRIVRSGFKRFPERMRKAAKGIRHTTLQRLWASAELSVLHEHQGNYANLIEETIRRKYAEWEKRRDQRKSFEAQMVEILNRLREEDPNIPPPTPQIISEKNLAKLLGETGPLSDFQSWRQILRYAGLNLRERESGTYKGGTKTSKKGRPRLRKILGNILLPIVPKHKLYGDFYHGKKKTMCGNKAMVTVMRNFLRKFFGWYKAGGGSFDQKRFFNSKSEWEKLRIAA